MKHNFHGLFSLSLIVIAISISIFTLFNYSLMLGSFYLIICFFSSLIILRVFCAKCPSRKFCGHKIPGLIAAKLFPQISANPFTIGEWFLIISIIFLIISIPQYWLFKSIGLFFTYWSILIGAGIEIKLTVCIKCKNEFCPSNPLFKGLH